MICARCGARYPIADGILDLFGGQPAIDDVSLREVAARDADAATYDLAFSYTRNAMEIPSTLRWLDVQDKLVADFGCGTGRITRHLVGEARGVLAIDFSRDSLQAFARRLPQNAHVGLVLANATATRLTVGALDIAVSTQVVEHIPTAERRAEFFRHVRAALKDGGMFVLTAYHHDLRRIIRRESQEGSHPSGVYYHYFTPAELRQEVERYFRIETMRYLQVQLPLLGRLPLGWGRFSRLMEPVPVLNRFGHLLLIAGRVPPVPAG